jgi:hypothetical protein
MVSVGGLEDQWCSDSLDTEYIRNPRDMTTEWNNMGKKLFVFERMVEVSLFVVVYFVVVVSWRVVERDQNPMRALKRYLIVIEILLPLLLPVVVDSLGIK